MNKKQIREFEEKVSKAIKHIPYHIASTWKEYRITSIEDMEAKLGDSKYEELFSGQTGIPLEVFIKLYKTGYILPSLDETVRNFSMDLEAAESIGEFDWFFKTKILPTVDFSELFSNSVKI